MYIAIVNLPIDDDAINFEINLNFIIKLFFLHDQNSQDKNLNIL